MTEPVTTETATTAKSGVDVAGFASRRGLVWRRFLRNKPAAVSLVLLVVLFIGCYALPPVLPYRYTDMDFTALQQPPSLDHWILREPCHSGASCRSMEESCTKSSPGGSVASTSTTALALERISGVTIHSVMLAAHSC